MDWHDGYLTVDWGTTNRRAYRIDPAGALVDSFADDRGVTAVPRGGFEAEVAAIRARLGDLPMLLAGMIGSDRGWQAAPYVPCPAGLDGLAAGIRWVEPGRTGIVPGVCQTEDQGGADVMRGEEVQLLGAVAAGRAAADGLICHPGTHAKWVRMAGGRIAAFRTMMTGELFGLLGAHSILAPQLAAPVEPGAAFDAGVREALAGADILSGLFRIRARHLLAAGSADAASHASGLLIGCDVRAGLHVAPEGAVSLIGRPDLCALYALALARAGRESCTVDGAEAFLAGIRQLVKRP